MNEHCVMLIFKDDAGGDGAMDELSGRLLRYGFESSFVQMFFT